MTLLAKEPFAKITVRQLTQESGYSRRTYYRYFGSKEAILNDLFLQYLAAYYQYLQGKTITVVELPNLFLNFIWPKREAIQLLVKQNLLLSLITSNMKTIVETLLKVKVPWRKELANTADTNALIYSVGGFCVLLDAIFRKELPTSVKPISASMTSALKEILQSYASNG